MLMMSTPSCTARVQSGGSWQTQVQRVDTIAPHLTGRHEVNRYRRAVNRCWSSERGGDERNWSVRVGGKDATLVAPQRARYPNVNLWHDVAASAVTW